MFLETGILLQVDLGNAIFAKDERKISARDIANVDAISAIDRASGFLGSTRTGGKPARVRRRGDAKEVSLEEVAA
jgi:hypothetical protein